MSARRVLNLIGKSSGSGSVKQWAVIKLLMWQPLAKRIRFEGKCHCKRGQMLTYQLIGSDYDRGENTETCGYYCPSCGFSNAGSRDKQAQS